MDSLAKNYYASSFRGEMGSEEFNQALRDWINEQTGGLLEAQADGLSMDPETVMALASTIYYRGTVSSTRAERKRACSICSVLMERPWSATSCTRAAATPITGQISSALLL
mgnify:FL=1